MLSGMSFERTDCDCSVYVYQPGNARIVLPIHVDDLLLASSSKAAIQEQLALTSSFAIGGPATSIFAMKIERDRIARTIGLSQPGYIESILETIGVRS